MKIVQDFRRHLFKGKISICRFPSSSKDAMRGKGFEFRIEIISTKLPSTLFNLKSIVIFEIEMVNFSFTSAAHSDCVIVEIYSNYLKSHSDHKFQVGEQKKTKKKPRGFLSFSSLSVDADEQSRKTKGEQKKRDNFHFSLRQHGRHHHHSN